MIEEVRRWSRYLPLLTGSSLTFHPFSFCALDSFGRRRSQFGVVGRDLPGHLKVPLGPRRHAQGLKMVGQSDMAFHIAGSQPYSRLKGLHNSPQIIPLPFKDGGQQRVVLRFFIVQSNGVMNERTGLVDLSFIKSGLRHGRPILRRPFQGGLGFLVRRRRGLGLWKLLLQGEPLARVLQHAERLSQLAEFRFCFDFLGPGVPIRMPPLRQPMVRCFDVLWRGVGRDLQHIEWIHEVPGRARDRCVGRDGRTGLEQWMVAYFHPERRPVLQNRVGSFLTLR